MVVAVLVFTLGCSPTTKPVVEEVDIPDDPIEVDGHYGFITAAEVDVCDGVITFIDVHFLRGSRWTADIPIQPDYTFSGTAHNDTGTTTVYGDIRRVDYYGKEIIRMSATADNVQFDIKKQEYMPESCR